LQEATESALNLYEHFTAQYQRQSGVQPAVDIGELSRIESQGHKVYSTSEDNVVQFNKKDEQRFKRNSFIRELRDIHGASLSIIASQFKLSVRQVGSILKHREPFVADKSLVYGIRRPEDGERLFPRRGNPSSVSQGLLDLIEQYCDEERGVLSTKAV
jgi:hypothetical protein